MTASRIFAQLSESKISPQSEDWGEGTPTQSGVLLAQSIERWIPVPFSGSQVRATWCELRNYHISHTGTSRYTLKYLYKQKHSQLYSREPRPIELGTLSQKLPVLVLVPDLSSSGTGTLSFVPALKKTSPLQSRTYP